MSIVPQRPDVCDRLKDLDAAEVRKRNREEARNLLEAQIYRLRDQLQLHDFIDASTESERVTLRRTIEASNQWLWDEGDQASTKELKAARSELESVTTTGCCSPLTGFHA